MKYSIKAVRSAYGVKTEYDQFDCKILNKVAKLIIKYGAISVERLQGITQYQSRTVRWALFHLEALEALEKGGLYILPELTD